MSDQNVVLDPATETPAEPATQTTSPSFAVNDVVSVKDTVADVEFVGVLGYVKAVTPTTATVSFYYPHTAGEPAYARDQDFLLADLFLVGKCNPDLLPN